MNTVFTMGRSLLCSEQFRGSGAEIVFLTQGGEPDPETRALAERLLDRVLLSREGRMRESRIILHGGYALHSLPDSLQDAIGRAEQLCRSYPGLRFSDIYRPHVLTSFCWWRGYASMDELEWRRLKLMLPRLGMLAGLMLRYNPTMNIWTAATCNDWQRYDMDREWR